MEKKSPDDGCINRLVLVKGKEQYVFYYEDSERRNLIKLLLQYAKNPELSFSMYDAAVLSHKANGEAAKLEAKPLPQYQRNRIS